MAANQPIPAAQYLRMSTEHQQYSLENQSTAIREYAESHGFEVIRTYSDSARSGVVLKHRAGLRQLLEDVVAGDPGYQAVLVYDVSRWGRFQDIDESAHYEFLCKSSGVPILYCGEAFANDGTLPSLIMKALKRTMAGEYSRELSVKVLAGQRRLAQQGFWQGAVPGYGLRRMLVSPDRVPKQALVSGERKSIATDRVTLVPGPAHEVDTVRTIYRMFVSEKRSAHGIARKLNDDGVLRPRNSKWDHGAVREILTNPKYTGCAVFGRTTSKLHTPEVKLPKSEWIVRLGAFEPIVDAATFIAAQRVYEGRTFGTTNEELLDDLRVLLASMGRLSLAIIRSAADMASPSTYRHRFGGLRNAYKLVGYAYPSRLDSADLRRRIKKMHEELVAEIARAFPKDLSVVRRGNRRRSLLRLAGGVLISVRVVASVRVWRDTYRWIVDATSRKHRLVTLLARLDESNSKFLDFHVFPNIDRRNIFRLSLNDDWLRRGKRLTDLSRFCEVVKQVRAARRRGFAPRTGFPQSDR